VTAGADGSPGKSALRVTTQTVAFVADFDGDGVTEVGGSQGHRTRAVLQRIVEQDVEYLPHRRSRSGGGRQPSIDHREAPIERTENRPPVTVRLAQLGLNVDTAGRTVGVTAERQQVIDGALEPAPALQGVLNGTVQVSIRTGQRRFQPEEQPRERGAELMGGVGAERPFAVEKAAQPDGGVTQCRAGSVSFAYSGPLRIDGKVAVAQGTSRCGEPLQRLRDPTGLPAGEQCCHDEHGKHEQRHRRPAAPGAGGDDGDRNGGSDDRDHGAVGGDRNGNGQLPRLDALVDPPVQRGSSNPRMARTPAHGTIPKPAVQADSRVATRRIGHPHPARRRQRIVRDQNRDARGVALKLGDLPVPVKTTDRHAKRQREQQDRQRGDRENAAGDAPAQRADSPRSQAGVKYRRLRQRDLLGLRGSCVYRPLAWPFLRWRMPRSRQSLFAGLAAAAAVTTAAVGLAFSGAPAAAKVARSAAGTSCAGAAVPRWRHVVVVVLENHGYTQVIGHSPYLDSLAHACGLATNYHAVSYPSLPNYLAMTGGSTFGIGDDKPPSSHPIHAPSIFGQVASRSLEEGMRGTCSSTNGHLYAVKHNPQAYYVPIAKECRQNDVPLGSAPDLSAAYTFITPNLCHDTHNCSLKAGDRFLSAFIPQLVHSAQYRAGNTAIFLTWDSDDRHQSNHVATLVIAPSIRGGTRDPHQYSHYSLLLTTEQMLGVPAIANAANARSMRPGMHL